MIKYRITQPLLLLGMLLTVLLYCVISCLIWIVFFLAGFLLTKDAFWKLSDYFYKHIPKIKVMNKQQTELEWVERVINSCVTVDQTRSAENLVRLYAIKYNLQLCNWYNLLFMIDSVKMNIKNGII